MLEDLFKIFVFFFCSLVLGVFGWWFFFFLPLGLIFQS